MTNWKDACDLGAPSTFDSKPYSAPWQNPARDAKTVGAVPSSLVARSRCFRSAAFDLVGWRRVKLCGPRMPDVLDYPSNAVEFTEPVFSRGWQRRKPTWLVCRLIGY
jgi:hypothetical protein